MDKMKQWALLTVLVIVAVAVGGWFLLISPQRSKASDLRTQTTSQEDRNRQLRSDIASLQAQHKGLPQVQAELAKLGVQLPNNPGLPALIRSLSSAADAAGVDLISMAPSKPSVAGAGSGAPASVSPGGVVTPTATGSTATGTTPPATGSTATGTTPTSTGSAATGTGTTAAPGVNAGSLLSINISVVVNGGYFQIEQFVSNLEALTRPFLTVAIGMTPQSPAKPATSGAAAATTAPTSTGVTSSYDGHVQATITGQVFMVSGANAAPSTATK